jgi:threonine/homoserine/homoserine lactone efflux protein
LGAASADAVYGATAAFGLTLVTGFLVSQQSILRIVGGLFLIYLGMRTFLAPPVARSVATSAAPVTAPDSARPAQAADHIGSKGLSGAYFSTFALTLTNPLTILSFAAIFAGLGLASEERSTLAALGLVFGVFLGSATWWLFLSGLVSLFRDRFGSRVMTWVNRISGAIILGFGVAALVMR